MFSILIGQTQCDMLISMAVSPQHTHESDEKSPCGLDSPGPSQGERVAKHPATGQEQKALAIRRRKELERARKEERRRKQNARRLEGQKREFERKCEVRRKAEEATGAAVAAVAAGGDTSDATRAQTPNKGGPGEYPRQGEARPRRRNEEAPRAKPRREQQPQSPGVENRIPREGQVRSKQGKNPRAVAEADDQKVDTENDAAEFLGRDADAPCLIYTDREEYSVSSLMRHVCVFLPPWGNETDHQPSLNPSVIVGPSTLSQHQWYHLHHP